MKCIYFLYKNTLSKSLMSAFLNPCCFTCFLLNIFQCNLISLTCHHTASRVQAGHLLSSSVISSTYLTWQRIVLTKRLQSPVKCLRKKANFFRIMRRVDLSIKALWQSSMQFHIERISTNLVMRTSSSLLNGRFTL
jgi:hypothetical protein